MRLYQIVKLNEVCRGKELPVECQHFDAPSDNIFDGAARTMIAGAKLKVVQRVVGFLECAPVMHGFSWQKFSAKELFHHMSMFKFCMCRLAVRSREPNNNVAALDTASSLRQTVPLSVQLAYPFVLALTRAKLLFAVNVASRFATCSRERLTAVLARDCVASVGLGPLGKAKTLQRAKLRVFVEFSAVLRKGAGGIAERFSAVLAGESRAFGARMTRCGTAVGLFVGRYARFGTEAPFAFAKPGYHKKLTALDAQSLDVRRRARCRLARFAAKMLRSLGGANAERLAAMFAILRDWHGTKLLQWHGGEYPY